MWGAPQGDTKAEPNWLGMHLRSLQRHSQAGRNCRISQGRQNRCWGSQQRQMCVLEDLGLCLRGMGEVALGVCFSCVAAQEEESGRPLHGGCGKGHLGLVLETQLLRLADTEQDTVLCLPAQPPQTLSMPCHLTFSELSQSLFDKKNISGIYQFPFQTLNSGDRQ